MEKNLSRIQPWKLKPIEYSYQYKHYISGRREYKTGIAHCIRKIVPDKQAFHKMGDICKFSSGFYECEFGDGRDWFLKTRKEKEQYWKPKPIIPKYARNQYAIMMARYSITRKNIGHLKIMGAI